MATARAEYTVVARRYRPQQFAELIGQEAVAQTLCNALTSERVAHAYLFTGARGVGKTSAARILAKALNCAKGPTPKPCDQCSSCVGIAAGDDIDVREIDGASNRQIDDIRAIRQEVSTCPARSRYKVYIIDEVHMLTRESFNALLKTLEEPPPHVKFIFATTDVQKVPVTILSRCQRFDFAMIPTDRIAAQLRAVVNAEGVKAEDEALEMIARRATGSMRDAQSLLDQLVAFGGESLTAVAAQQMLGIASPERIMSVVEAVAARDAKSALEHLYRLTSSGVQPAELLDQLIDYWRDLMLVACAGAEARDLNVPARFRDKLVEHAARLQLDTVMAGLDVLAATKYRLRGAGQVQTLLQMALIRLCRLDDLVSLSQLAQMLQAGAGDGLPAAAAPPRPAPAQAPGAVTQPPEGKKKPAADEPLPLNEQTLPAVWADVVSRVGPLLGTSLQRVAGSAISAPNTLVLAFPAEYNSAYESCSNPINLERLQDALRTRTGQTWRVRLEVLPPATPPPAAASPGNGPLAQGRTRPQDALRAFPLVRKAMDTLGALPIFVDQGFGEAAGRPASPAPETDNSETTDV